MVGRKGVSGTDQEQKSRIKRQGMGLHKGECLYLDGLSESGISPLHRFCLHGNFVSLSS
jgi:hypothetical protein